MQANIAAHVSIEIAMSNTRHQSAPTQQALLFPLLESIAEEGGRARSKRLCDKVAARIGLSDELRDRKVEAGKAGTINEFDRSVRWAQQKAKALKLAEPIGDGQWRLTGKGRRALREAKPGVVVTVFTTDSGLALFARAEDAVGLIEDGSIAALITSPPYPLLREKAYGNVTEKAYVEWFMRIAEHWPRKLTPEGSIVLNLADVWMPGKPQTSLYQERLLLALESAGIHLAQRFSWLNPAKLPAPAEWVTVRRERVKPGLEQIYWLSPNERPYADNRQVLRPYSRAMLDRLDAGGERKASRPSGFEMAENSFSSDNGGAIPSNLIVASNTESNSSYISACKRAGLPVHPARFPSAIPEFFISLLTRVGDLVYDPFGGSGTVARCAETLGRRWITSESILEYVLGQQLRFRQSGLAL